MEQNTLSHWQRGQYGIVRDIDYEGEVGTTIDNGYLRNILQQRERLNIDSKELFTIAMTQYINANIFALSEEDIRTLHKHIKELYFYRYRNALAYIVGYMIREWVPEDITNLLRSDEKKLNDVMDTAIQHFQSDADRYSMIRYARIWNSILKRAQPE